MRISAANFKAIKQIVFQWCGETGSYTNFTTKKISNEFPAGWLHGISANYYNRDHVQEYICSKAPELKNHVFVYAKEVFVYRKDNMKVLSYVIFIDGTLEKQQELQEFLYTHRWEKQYSGVTFISHNTTDSFTKEDRLKAIESHNKYLYSIDRVIVKVQGASTYHNIDGNTISFQEWMQSYEENGEKLFEVVEVAPNNVVRLIYNVANQSRALELKRELYNITEAYFGENITSSLLDKSKFDAVNNIHAKQAEYASFLRKRVLNETITNEDATTVPPSQKKPSFYFGSYCEVTKGGT